MGVLDHLDVVIERVQIGRCKENGRIEYSARHLLDAPGVVFGSYVGGLLALVPLEIGDRPRLLVDDSDADAPVVFDRPPEPIPVAVLAVGG